MSTHPSKLRARNIRRRINQKRAEGRARFMRKIRLHPERDLVMMAERHSEADLVKMRTRIPYGIKIEELRCNKCYCERMCPFAYDPYNTNGDCLASK